MKGKAIYTPAGKAAEYAKYACNFYVGCSHECEYCYLKKGIGKKVLGGNTPTLKACFKGNPSSALRAFVRELISVMSKDWETLKKHGIFFSFSTDPVLPETWDLTAWAIDYAASWGIPCTILTKKADYLIWVLDQHPAHVNWGKQVAFGFTLTGMDELEPGADSNKDRALAMGYLHETGYKTWASIEPIVGFDKSLAMINYTSNCCDLYRVGLMSGKQYSKNGLQAFVKIVTQLYKNNKFYFKDSLLRQAGISRCDLPANCVTRDYSLFEDNLLNK